MATTIDDNTFRPFEEFLKDYELSIAHCSIKYYNSEFLKINIQGAGEQELELFMGRVALLALTITSTEGNLNEVFEKITNDIGQHDPLVLKNANNCFVKTHTAPLTGQVSHLLLSSSEYEDLVNGGPMIHDPMEKDFLDVLSLASKDGPSDYNEFKREIQKDNPDLPLDDLFLSFLYGEKKKEALFHDLFNEARHPYRLRKYKVLWIEEGPYKDNAIEEINYNSGQIGYEPIAPYHQSSSYTFPYVGMPKPNARILMPRQSRIGTGQRVGHCDKLLLNALSIHFTDQLIISNKNYVPIVGSDHSYFPDITLIDTRDKLNLFIDVEIDEPYQGTTRIPIHCQGEDDTRNRFFTDRGWIVIRFTEKQVYQNTLGCCRFIGEIIKKIDPTFEVPTNLQQAESVETEPQWDLKQAQRWARNKYRENYLGINNFPETQVEEVELDTTPTSQDLEVESQIPKPKFDIEAGDQPSTLATKHEHLRDERIKFIPDSHTYYIDNNPDILSVSEFVQKFFAPFDPQWAAENLRPDHKLYGLPTNEIIAEFEAAGKRGTMLHKTIEFHFNGGVTVGPPPEFDHFLNFLKDHAHLSIYRTEWRVFDESLLIAGTVDALFKKEDGTFAMYDWKRAKKIHLRNTFQSGIGVLSHLEDCNYIHYSLQQNIYRRILEEHYDINGNPIRISEMNLVQLHPKHQNYQPFNVDRMDKEVDDMFRVLKYR